jgi:hypothetical protein
MNEIEFEAELRANGYTEIETQKLEPRPAKGEHGHPFSIRGSFAVAQGHPHDESIGPEGARVLVGRKFAKS